MRDSRSAVAAHEVDGTEVELPVLVKRGEAGTTTLAENVEALPAERYRVEQVPHCRPGLLMGRSATRLRPAYRGPLHEGTSCFQGAAAS